MRPPPAPTPPLVLVAAGSPELQSWAEGPWPFDARRAVTAPAALGDEAAALRPSVVVVDAPLDPEAAAALAERCPDALVLPLGGLPRGCFDVLASAALDQAGRLAAVRREADDFTYSVCHDVRSQLQGIIGLAGLLLEVEGDQLSAEGRDWCARIEHTGEALARMAQDLLDLTRLGRRAPTLTPVDLAALATDVAERLPVLFPERAPRLVVAGPLGSVLGDPACLLLALLHLVRNAIQHDPAPRPLLTLSVVPVDTAGAGPAPRRVALCLADHGPGVAPEAARRIFEPFQREPGAPASGAGLGLAIVARVARLHGGAARVRPNPGGGSIFELELPVASA